MKSLEPRAVWALFDEITQIPRPSKKEGKIVAWLVEFAQKHGLEYRRDAAGNVVILAPASPGRESHPTVILQNHVDMVCEKNSGVSHDFERDPIKTELTDNGWVRAQGTTLGADNGLGMAAALALLIDRNAVHGPLEALFTVDEETGLTGAFNLGTGLAADEKMITGKYLINLDSEDEGEIFIGCAGGIDTVATFDFEWKLAPAGLRFFEIAVSGLLGGHSGDDIEKGRGNANKILARILSRSMDFDASLSHIDGGNLRNAIPREARAVVGVPETHVEAFVDFIGKFVSDIRNELAHSDEGVQIYVKETDARPKVINADTARRLVLSLIGVPNGPQAMSFAVPGLVETSTNLASVKIEAAPDNTLGDTSDRTKNSHGKIVVTTSQRSSVESAKHAVAAAVEAVFALAGARVEHSEGYPGWSPDPDSHLLEVTGVAYERLFGTAAKVRAIHAGLECSLFLERHPHLEMVSFGPTIRGAHSPDERIEIATVDRFWRLLLETLRNL